MSVFVLVILGLIIEACLMISKYIKETPFSRVKKTGINNKNIEILKDLLEQKTVSSIYPRYLAFLLFIWLVVYVSKNNQFTQAVFIIMIFTALIYSLLTLYKKVLPLLILIAPFYLKLLRLLSPINNVIRSTISRIVSKESDFFDKEELVNFLIKQKTLSSDINKQDLELAVNAIKFSDLKVIDFYTPRKVVKFLNSETEVTTAFVDDLYKSGFSRFPVYSENQDNIVGTLYLKDLVEKRFSGKVSKIMSNEVYEINDKITLDLALKKFITTRHHLFIVENEFKEILGVITLEDVLEQLVGREIMDETDVHENMRTLAKS